MVSLKCSGVTGQSPCEPNGRPGHPAHELRLWMHGCANPAGHHGGPHIDWLRLQSCSQRPCEAR